MKRRTEPGVFELVRDLGGAFLELLRAELAALRADLGRSGRSAALGVAIVGAGGFVVFWSVAALLAATIALFSRWLPLWGAAALCGGLLLVLGGGAVWVGWRRLLKAIDQPAKQVRARVDDHVGWWHERLLDDGRAIEAGDAVEAESDD